MTSRTSTKVCWLEKLLQKPLKCVVETGGTSVNTNLNLLTTYNVKSLMIVQLPSLYMKSWIGLKYNEPDTELYMTASTINWFELKPHLWDKQLIFRKRLENEKSELSLVVIWQIWPKVVLKKKCFVSFASKSIFWFRHTKNCFTKNSFF